MQTTCWTAAEKQAWKSALAKVEVASLLPAHISVGGVKSQIC